ncbi:MAG: hypothetical protein GY952_00195 [Rhodobacteraceae bacterium]|nr:hypothetical protein [Paracoccaceae bacterium]
MDTHMSKEVLEGLRRAKAQSLHRKDRLRVVVGEEYYPVLRSWDGGFSLDIEDAPHLRGTVEFCDGTRELYECLIVCSAQEGNEMVYEYKRVTPAVDQHPVDFEIADDAPVAYLGKSD